MGIQVGSYLRAAREKAGLSQSDLAERLNLKSPQSISNIERGIAPLPRSMIPAMAEILRLEREELIDILVDEVRQKYEAVLDDAQGVAGRSPALAPRKLKLKGAVE